MAQDRLMLVDGTAVLYRAFFAIRELSTASGKPTNAVFGFIRMLRQMRNTWSPTHWAVVFDGGMCRERVAALPQYKAQRPRMPEDLRMQVPTAQEYLAQADVAWIVQDGQEGDDVLASLAAQSAGRAAEILIATSDKDLFQLVGERTRIVPLAGQGGALGPAEVKLKMGVAPAQIVALLALIGDHSDNIPGVPGIGPKTGARLLAQYGSLDGLRQHLGELDSGKLRSALQEHWGLVMRNVEVVRLRTDLECGLKWDDLRARRPDTARLIPFFKELEFEGMAKELQQPGLFEA
jgi:DNA polymerase-1